MTTTQKFYLQAAVKSVTEPTDDAPYGAFEAVLSMSSLDRDGEVIDPGAFNPLPKSIPILADHNGEVRSLVARAEPYYDGDVLKAKGRFASHEFAQYVRGLLTEGILDTMSVGFMPPSRKTVAGVPHITKSELLEASFVVIPSNRDALVSMAKSMADKQYVDVEPVDGSFEDTQEDLREAIRAMYPQSYVGILATFGDRCVFSLESYPTLETDGTYEVAYTYDETADAISLDTPVAVEVQQVVTPKTMARLSWKLANRKDATQSNLDAAHDAVVAAGATCPGAEVDDGKGFDLKLAASLVEFDLDEIDDGLTL